MLFACKSKNNNSIVPTPIDSASIYSYKECIANLGLTIGKTYTLTYNAKPYSKDTIVFNYAGSISETKYETFFGTDSIGEVSFTYPISVVYELNGVYSISTASGIRGIYGNDLPMYMQVYPRSPINPKIYLHREGDSIIIKCSQTYLYKIIL